MRLNVEKKIGTKEVTAIMKKYQEGASKSATMKALFAGGLDVKEIVAITGFKYQPIYNTIKNEILSQGLQADIINEGRAAGDTKKARIIELLQAGASITEAAAETKSLYNQVWAIAKAIGVTGKKETTEVKVG